MALSGRELDKWTLIWPDNEERYRVSVADGHGHPPEPGATMIEVVRAPNPARGAEDPSPRIWIAYLGEPTIEGNHVLETPEEAERYDDGGWTVAGPFVPEPTRGAV